MIPKRFFITNIIIASSCGFVMNFILLYLLLKRTPGANEILCSHMRVHCVTDILYDLTHLTTGVNPAPIGGKVYLITQGFFTHVNLEYSRLVFSLYFWAVLVAIALLPIDFIYRYLSVCRNRELSSKSISLMVFAAYFITWLHAFPNSLNYLIVGPTQNTTEYTEELDKFELFKGDFPSYGVTQLGGTKALSNFIFILILNAFTYTLIIYTSTKIYHTLKANAHKIQNPKTLDLQRQVTRILTLQAILPLIVICIPTITIVAFALSHTDVPQAGAICMAFLCWLSAVKPLATILVVPRYRTQVRQWLVGRTCFNCWSNRTQSIKPHGTTTIEETASLPLVVICIPTCTIVFLALSHTDVPKAGAYYMAVLCWLTMLKPLATIIIVPRYRHVVKHWFHQVGLRIQSTRRTTREVPTLSAMTVISDTSTKVDAEDFY
ncbi:hypothetical protein M3Y97_00999600 [Aphelenchoides bicaudatus]|nr:hypothetical protein M3Y97_00999600 [Aphelenchoides bicaudatus]